MTTRQRKELLNAAREIVNEDAYSICFCLSSDTCLYDIAEAKLFNPHSTYWWGWFTVGESPDHPVCRNARLMGIAFMLTMPKEILEGKCFKKKTK